VFIVGSLLWGVAFDGFHPDRSDLAGALFCLAGVGVIMFAR
jgi:small multidrug resistance family-3 protein